MALFSSTQPSLRARILPRFPAQVLAGSGIVITKSGLSYTFAQTFQDYPLSALEDMPQNSIVGRDDTLGTGPPSPIAVAGSLFCTGAGTLEANQSLRTKQLALQIYQNGSVLTTGVKGDILVPFGGTILKVVLLADQVGSVVLDIWNGSFGSFPPTVVGSITAAAKPTLSSAASYRDTDLTGWSTALVNNNCLRFNIDSVSTITRLHVSLSVLVI